MTRRRLPGGIRNLLLAATAVLVSYGLAELVATTLYLRGILEPASIWIHERTDPAGNLRYDPVRGSYLSPTPARFASIASNGVVESTGLYRGNNRGFPDRDDFAARRSTPRSRRLAVLGDSYTSGQFLQRNWPDRAEELARREQGSLELLNFSLDGGGLGNWARVLGGFVQPRGYQLDGAIFAIWGEDLKRRFGWWDDAPRTPGGEPEPVLFGRPQAWGLDAIPASRALALAGPHEESARRLAVTPALLEQALGGSWRPPFQRSFERPFLWMRARGVLDRVLDPEDFSTRRGMFHAGQKWLIREIQRVLAELELPVLVVRVPNRVEHRSWEGEAEAFAEILGATFVDGGEAFAGLGAAEFEECWLPYDRHFSQVGSDRFARFVYDVLKTWP